jgi:hypothetical protein
VRPEGLLQIVNKMGFKKKSSCIVVYASVAITICSLPSFTHGHFVFYLPMICEES